MSIKVVGGRGKKAPYKTLTIRVPEDLVPMIEELSDEYKEAIINGKKHPLRWKGMKVINYKDLEEMADGILYLTDRADIALDLFIREIEMD